MIIIHQFDKDDKIIIFERGALLFVFNFNPTKVYL